ncbi:MAG: hypothetical protein K5650_01140 [Bacteroidales bacterium]|nr:hypothetical protein [Bacteroidales bacterium]
MKNSTLLMTIIMTAIIAPAKNTIAQEIIFSLPIPSQRSIVRSVTNDTCLTYSEDATGSYFSLSKLLDGTTSHRLPFSPTPVANGVNDICILKNQNVAYFCGTNTSGTSFFGGLSLSSLMTPSTSLSINITPAPLVFGNDTIVNLNKIAAFKAVSGDIHLILIGMCSLRNAGPHIISSCIIDAYAPSPTSTSWQMEMYTFGKTDWVFHDVAITDNYVVVAGKNKPDMRPHKVWFFNKPVSSNETIFDATSNVPYATGNTAIIGNGAVVHCGGDTVATAYLVPRAGIAPGGIMLSLYAGTNNYMRYIISSPVSGYNFTGEVKDMAYWNDGIYLLHDLLTPTDGTVSAILHVDTAFNIDCRYENISFGNRNTSLDVNLSTTNSAVVSGTLPINRLTLHNFDFTNPSSSCSNDVIELALPYTTDVRDFDEMLPIDRSINMVSPTLSIATMIINKICQ